MAPPITSVTRAVELRTSSSILWLAFSPPEVAVTVALATPRPGLLRRRNSTTSSPTAEKAIDFFASAATSSGPVVVTESATSFTVGSSANTETGSATLSSGPRTRGSVASSISGRRTKAAFSAAPKAASRPATTITRTAPTYCGISTLCVPVARAASRNGPRNRTIGGKRLARRPLAWTAASSPPIASMRSIAAP